MTLYAHRNYLISVNRAEEDGTILTMAGEIPIKKNQMYGVDLDGNAFPISDTRFNDYIPVERIKERKPKKHLSPFEEMYARQIAEFKGTLEQDESDLHIKNELVSDKAF